MGPSIDQEKIREICTLIKLDLKQELTKNNLRTDKTFQRKITNVLLFCRGAQNKNQIVICINIKVCFLREELNFKEREGIME